MLRSSHFIFITGHSIKVASMNLSRIRTILGGSNGQGLAEYALILGLIAVTAIAALIFMGNGVSTILSTISDKL